MSAVPSPASFPLPLFPLHAVLFPGGLLPLRIFEQRYVAMTKACVRDGTPFGVCLITRGSEVALRDGRREPDPEIARVGTLAHIERWDMQELGIFHLEARGTERFEIESCETHADGLLVAQCRRLPAEPATALPEAHAVLASLLERIADRIGPQRFPAERRMQDATWVGYRLAELLPVELATKQVMLETSDSLARLAELEHWLRKQHRA